MMARTLSCLLTLVNISAVSQSWEFVRSYDLEQPITAVDVGSLGKVYVGTSRGNVYSFQSDGSPEAQFSSAVFQSVSCIDAANQLKVFVYYSTVGKFEFLDRFSAMERTYHIADFGVPSAQLAMPAINNSIWFLSGSEMVQVNPLDRMVLVRIALSGVTLSRPNQLRIMSGGFAISDEMGIHLFRNSGQLLFSVEAKGICGFQLEGNELLAVADEGLLMLNVITSQTNWLKPPHANPDFVVRSQGFYHFVKDSQIVTYQRAD
jgi:hypothetical protein